MNHSDEQRAAFFYSTSLLQWLLDMQLITGEEHRKIFTAIRTQYAAEICVI